jgi:hypothetical protein
MDFRNLLQKVLSKLQLPTQKKKNSNYPHILYTNINSCKPHKFILQAFFHELFIAYYPTLIYILFLYWIIKYY